MNKLHENSSCFHSKAIRFGGRRRQCKSCRKTWRVWRCHRGRKRKRFSANLVQSYLEHTVPPVSAVARARGQPISTAKHRLASSLKLFNGKTPWPIVSTDNQFIAIADAWTKKIKGSYHTWYGILLRPLKDNQATILPLPHFEGRESIPDWRLAFDTVPKKLLGRIVALVCDGHRGLVNEARWRGWLIQRCHFHLIAAIQGRRSRWHDSRHRKEGERLYRLISTVLAVTDDAAIPQLLDEIENIGWQTKSRQLRKALSGFVNHIENYRTYLKHPGLNLPRTSNTAETLFSLVEELCHRARGFSSVESLSRWIEAVVKHRKTITCNGKNNRIN